jgi:CRISPR-associated endonuclease/helicase Cas3
MFYAHSLKDKPDTSDWQRLDDHMIATGRLAGEFAREFRATEPARLAGLLHDLGKYSEKFQARLRGSTERVDHAAAGAIEIKRIVGKSEKLFAELISYAIAGHHAGLDDFAPLRDRLADMPLEPIDDIWRQEIKVGADALRIDGFKPSKNPDYQLAFLGRMIFSCLVDADYKDTESFYAAHQMKVVDHEWPDLRAEIDTLLSRFETFMADKQKQVERNPLNGLRKDILTNVLSKAGESAGLFTLTVPTGGGKTLASLGFALRHVKAHNLRRIVYAIPFTSIIEQNAAVFRDVLGNDYILEHHSSIETEKVREQQDKLKLAMEDWAAPVVVTTNVQLFESLFANRSSRCRKLHNLANSVIILDEAQTLPLPLLRPCLAALDELALNYGASIIFCTATQPALDVRDFGKGGLKLEGRELAPNPAELATKLRRTKIERATKELEDDELVEALATQEQVLVIVNRRTHALDLYNKAKQAGLSGLVHLTTRQYAIHRREILAEVREALREGRPCRLIATSLVEAGVDIDFPRVWRAEAGLDQIAQAVGRCNREGRNAPEDSTVTVFKPKEHKPPREIAQLASAFARIADNFDDLLSPDAMKEYFREVYWQKGDEQLDQKKILDEFKVSGGDLNFNYKTAAQNFRMIESGLVPIIINIGREVQDVLERLNNAESSPGKAARQLQSYAVQIPPKDLNLLIQNKRVEYHRSDLWGDQFAVLTDSELYTHETGLLWENADILGKSIF